MEEHNTPPFFKPSTMKSEYKKINIKDITEGFLLTIGSTVAGLLGVSVVSGTFPTDAELLNIGKVGLLAGGLWLYKKFITNSEGQLLKKEPGNIE